MLKTNLEWATTRSTSQHVQMRTQGKGKLPVTQKCSSFFNLKPVFPVEFDTLTTDMTSKAVLDLSFPWKNSFFGRQWKTRFYRQPLCHIGRFLSASAFSVSLMFRNWMNPVFRIPRLKNASIHTIWGTFKESFVFFLKPKMKVWFPKNAIRWVFITSFASTITPFWEETVDIKDISCHVSEFALEYYEALFLNIHQ